MKNNKVRPFSIVVICALTGSAHGQTAEVTESAIQAPSPVIEATDSSSVVEAAAAPVSETTELSALPAVPATPVVPVASPAPMAQADTLSVDFPEEDIRNILRNVADLFELNIVVPDALQGRTSLKLRDVTWRQIFKVVLEPVGYTFIEDANIIKVVTLASLDQEPLVTEVFILNYSRAKEVQPTLAPLVKGGLVQVDERNNALIISARPSVLKDTVVPAITILDKATEQVMIETKFIELNADTSRDVGLNWTATGGLTTGAQTQGVATGTKTNPAGYTSSGGSQATVLPPAGVPTSVNTFAPGLNYSTAVLSNVELASALRFIESKGDSKIVSNPTVVTLNNTEAFINVGEEYPIPSYTYNTERGAFEVSGFEYKPIGIILKVTPQINHDGFVKLMVEPEISSSNRSAQFGGTSTSPAADIPIIETRKTKTQVSLKDGHTLGIGGLISETKSNGENKLPFFGDIPGVGRLFTSKSKDVQRRNLMIFITAKIVSGETADAQEIFDSRQIKAAGIKRSDLPGQRDTSVSAFLPEEDAAADKKSK